MAQKQHPRSVSPEQPAPPGTRQSTPAPSNQHALERMGPACVGHNLGPTLDLAGQDPMSLVSELGWGVESEEVAPGARLLHIRAGDGPTYVALHGDEHDSVEAAIPTLMADGGHLLVLVHGGGRYLRFEAADRTWQIDPNRIFTDDLEVLVEEAIEQFDEWEWAVDDDEAHEDGEWEQDWDDIDAEELGSEELNEVRAVISQLRDRILAHVCGPIVALHNNSDDGGLTIDAYVNGQYARDAVDTHKNDTLDVDDFFYVTHEADFEATRDAGFSTVLQDPEIADDGSLSVYAQHQATEEEPEGLRYINIEAEDRSNQDRLDAGKPTQADMVALAADLLAGREPGTGSTVSPEESDPVAAEVLAQIDAMRDDSLDPADMIPSQPTHTPDPPAAGP